MPFVSAPILIQMQLKIVIRRTLIRLSLSCPYVPLIGIISVATVAQPTFAYASPGGYVTSLDKRSQVRKNFDRNREKSELARCLCICRSRHLSVRLRTMLSGV